jgi:hypothetical protein
MTAAGASSSCDPHNRREALLNRSFAGTPCGRSALPQPAEALEKVFGREMVLSQQGSVLFVVNCVRQLICRTLRLLVAEPVADEQQHLFSRDLHWFS